MELYTLDNVFRRKTIVEGYESIIWTDRFNELGDFKFVLPSSMANKMLYQPGLYFGLNKSDRVMKLETVEDSMDDEGRKVLTFSGRSIESVLDRRVAWGYGTNANYALGSDPEWVTSGLPLYLIEDMVIKSIQSSTWAPNNVPNLLLTSLYPPDGLTPPNTNITVRLTDPKTSAYSYVKDLCKKYFLGFRIYRGPDDGYLYFNAYVGTDRSLGQNQYPTVLFDQGLENIVNITSLRSIEPKATACFVFSPLGFSVAYDETSSSTLPTGLDRLPISINVKEPEELITEAEQIAYRLEKGREELSNHKERLVLDGEISQTSGYVYNKDYYLGDRVDVRDHSNLRARMRVTEQIFTEDSDGERAYPTLEAESLVTPGSWSARNPLDIWSDAIGEWEDQ